MNVLVDTSVWSLALRRNTPGTNPEVSELRELIREARAVLVGPVRQEVLSGIKSEKQFLLLRERLRAFPDVPLEMLDFELAAKLYNVCRGKGVQGSNTDFLICAIAKNRSYSILTTDKDFNYYREHVEVSLHKVR